jgi:hypothetical protein
MFSWRRECTVIPNIGFVPIAIRISKNQFSKSTAVFLAIPGFIPALIARFRLL